LFEILDRAPAIADPHHAVLLDRMTGHVRFEGVSFAYPGAERPALIDVDFEVRPGRLLGIVGAPGSGKTTIAHLIPRFYDVDAGRITLDGYDVRELSLTSLRKAVAVAAQDIFLFDQPAAANIAYAVPNATESRIVAAAAAARIDEHIVAMPLGYATPVGERGVSLSGGQRQRMSIARGLAPDPALLVLDDSLSAVDTATEAQLRASLRASRADRATIIIAHRLSAVMDADEIIVLEQGRILERGTHQSLMAFGGRYAALYQMQADQPARAGLAEVMA
jgi:ATP-binding cassette subfamily B protein